MERKEIFQKCFVGNYSKPQKPAQPPLQYADIVMKKGGEQ